MFALALLLAAAAQRYFHYDLLRGSPAYGELCLFPDSAFNGEYLQFRLLLLGSTTTVRGVGMGFSRKMGYGAIGYVYTERENFTST